MLNRRWVLARRPAGKPSAEDFRFEQMDEDIPLGEGEVVVRHRLVSLDPYVRWRMSAAQSYSPPMELGSPIVGVALGDVVESCDPSFEPGETVLIGGGEVRGGGWQDYSVGDAASVRKVVSDDLPETAFFGPLGTPGFTAYSGLMQIGKPQPGETVVVSAGTGAVGSMVGQFARAEGCRAIAIAGGVEKCTFAIKDLGYNDAVDHRAPDFETRLAAACPNGVDIYFENVGGKVAGAVRPLLNDFARIPVCGLISQYNAESTGDEAETLAPFMRDVLTRRLTVRGFIVSDFFTMRQAFMDFARPLVAAGQLVWKDDIVEGLESAPEAFMGLLEGRNFGKLLVRVT